MEEKRVMQRRRERYSKQNIKNETEDGRRRDEEEVMKEEEEERGEEMREYIKNMEGSEEREKRKEREGETDMNFYIKCPDVTSSEGVRPRGSTLINKVTRR